ncbi:antibiotic biosynthesis monooxygenase [Kutzneria sp. 744]|uniref:antibiotic biosynthesis monooxygenase n=1 Tax=Kutzneria sp. (strain 744) TaxID=345341 RepID=UPI0003EEAFB5|nr:antibiotic biosynthesis monooxygenase [Kutzneria sp. 744]EWM11606.1 basic proline-rich protein [Kutzneria sp. 744]
MSGPITVTLSYQVRRGRGSQFSVSATSLLGTAATQPGYLGAGVMGAAPTGREWEVFYRFDGEASLAEWEQSHAYARWIEYVEKFATRSEARRSVDGESWSVEHEPAQPLPRVAAPSARVSGGRAARRRQEEALREEAEREAAEREAAQREVALFEAAQREAALADAAQREALEREAAQREAALLEATAKREATQREAALFEAAQLEAAQREAIQREALEREAGRARGRPA